MSMFQINLKPIVAATLAALVISTPGVMAQDGVENGIQDGVENGTQDGAPAGVAEMLPEAEPEGPRDLDTLLERLAQADEVDAARLTREIELEWSKSGSPAMDLLLKRGRDALEGDEPAVAAEHFGALTDHAPGFAEGWHGHAQAMANLGKFGVAIDDIQRVLSLNPRHYDAIFGLGLIFEQIGRANEAFEAYEMVLSIHPHHAGALDGVKRVKKDVSGANL
ncbi:tetratricopeptide repeat protein [Rhodalgimonas zhirmunskyi]|uniref:Tetratricopeptide repeat protein n=1 Tax=Rhodalgimonas zhirmunskyi TaxID=2964767 RepID=A0AAJ1UAG2_9RHOB|nr:tetratricopeptide repeat protein [Rhodoalgimonas zhirmunskyi]MDQ2094815.1 tetratricopeptide repeat protein [Rhodoalgimonas zhirmunskyi]